MKELKFPENSKGVFELDLSQFNDFTFNKYDFAILSLCLTPKSVLELQRTLEIAYKNLLAHLKKLEKYEMIEIKDYGKGKKKEIKTNFGETNVQAFLMLIGIEEWAQMLDGKEVKIIKK